MDRRAGGVQIADVSGPSAGLAAEAAGMPLLARGQMRKRWRYVAVFAPELTLCAARAQVGPFWQSFWVLWDRDERRRYDGTRLRPGARQVRMEGERIEIRARDVRASLVLGEGTPIEAKCPSGSGWGWTRKRCGVPVRGTVEADGRRWDVDALAVDDESAGYHQRHTSWLWSAGVGSAVDGRPVAWNLVEGINDPPTGSERAIWVDGEPYEPRPVSFGGLDRIGFADGTALDFAAETERARRDNLLLVRSSYRLRFGRFSGSLEGLALSDGLGVMEMHDAVW
ncbi:MAG TPA: DUF2804 family protein [Solirubrobacterales bacterium]|nr:DUF2804 family protein [Solirubrobacterales bacterium]